MQTKLIKLPNNICIITSDEEIKINDPITDGYRVWWWKDDCSLLGRKKIIATISPFKIEGLPMLKLPNQEDVDKLANKMCNKINWVNPRERLAYYNGIRSDYKAAQKKYSEEDMRKAIEMAREVSGMEAVVKLIQNEHLNTEDFQYTEEEIIQSL